jgi:hypothetical protein
MPVILVTQEAEVRRFAVRSQIRQIFERPYSRDPISKKNYHKKWLVEWLKV